MALSQKKYVSNNRYLKAHYKTIPFAVPREFADIVKLEAQARHMSVNGFIRYCIQREIARKSSSLDENDSFQDAD